MAEKSFFWDHDSGGHADYSPYDAQGFQRVFGLLTVYRPDVQGILPWGDTFRVSVVGNSVRVGTGRAIVSNAFYESDATKDYTVTKPASGGYYYLVVLRKDMGARTVRQKLLGPSPLSYPPVTRTDVVWDVPIVHIYSYADGRVFANIFSNVIVYPDGSMFFSIIARQGGSATDWSAQGTTQRTVALETAIQTGVALWNGSASSGSKSVAFPYPFDDAPIVFLGMPDNTNWPDTWRTTKMITAVGSIGSSGFTIYWKSIGGSGKTELHLTWMAIGPRTVK